MQPQAQAQPQYTPQQVVSDPDNPYLATPQGPRSAPISSPTFLPHEEEGVIHRLGKNIAQGWISGVGWHMFDMTNHVDFFPHKKKKDGQ